MIPFVHAQGEVDELIVIADYIEGRLGCSKKEAFGFALKVAMHWEMEMTREFVSAVEDRLHEIDASIQKLQLTDI